jgi:2-polyprenyl-3-methyl-5-hydroxy-6-metoxy-1,4-benzoquinol methylase
MASPNSFYSYINGFEKKLKKIELNQLSCSPYAKRYLHHLLQNSTYYLSIYAHVLNHAVHNATLPVGQMTLLDYGSGNGLLGIFAKYAGFGKVYLCDIDAAFVEASQELSTILEEPISGFVTGGLKELLLQHPATKPDVIVGTDVIEHIYDLNVFFDDLQRMNPQMISVFTTASNPDNPIKSASLKKLQIKDETVGGDPSDFALAGAEKHEAFVKIREQIIRTAFPALTENTIAALAVATRGLYKPAIIQAVNTFLIDGSMPVLPVGENTCHPLTGSFTERILPICSYQKIYSTAGFNCRIYNGFYNPHAKGIKKIINPILNMFVKILGRKIAPFITLKGTPII